MKTVALTIAGSDPSGGAGIQADLKTFHQLGVYGMSVITLLTIQNTQSVKKVQVLKPDFVLAQLESVIKDILPQAAKTGALGSKPIVEVIAKHAKKMEFPLVVDPVIVSKHGARLLSVQGQRALIRKLFPYATLITPNLLEAMILAKREKRSSLTDIAKAIADLGPKAVLITGIQERDQSIDLFYNEGQFHRFQARWIRTKHTHGTGCTLSAAITAELAQGKKIWDAINIAKKFVTKAIATNPKLGHGFGPLNLHAKLD
ncbi:MAG: bifunctional hydroxymethylpyrimidine kinase/phosphomethylpyrimidine kinase [Deltaproteobacteria bacterium]|nr:bifunctional hydroxymethylpyrimidine kinase/phosphomethylpyrimidine kinase [Deltaproteobacteria bacterium]